MADGTPYTPNAAIIVQDDEVTTVNGGAVAASKVQRMKMDSVGADGAHRDVSKDFPLPVYKPNRSATGNRPAITFGTTAAGSNTATAVSFAITLAGPTTVAGAFTSTVATGTAGTLYSAGDFAASRSVVSGDTLNVTITVSAT